MAKASQNWLMHKENPQYKAAKHKFQEFSKSGLYYCSICRHLVGGICKPKSLECQICGLIVHQICKLKMNTQCKYVCLSSQKTQFQHQCIVWIEGNLDLNSICAKCDLMCFTNYDLGGWSCLWCQRIVHDECKDQLGLACDIGKLRYYTISPEEIVFMRENNNSNPEQVNNSDGDDKIGTTTQRIILENSKNLSFKFQINEKKEPIVVIINKKSGGQSGANYLKQFYRQLNPIQVISVTDDGLDRLQLFSKIKNIKFLVAGGDGTIGSVLNYLRSLKIEEWKDQNPPLAILPLGTGNDLSLSLGWGGGDENKDVIQILNQVGQVDNIVHLDRWSLQMKQLKSLTSGRLSGIFKKSEENKISNFVMYNYCGIGLDAKYCLDFHNLRSKNPNFFKSRIGNKFIYTHMGLNDLFLGKKKELWKQIKIVCDNKEIEIPEGIENVVVLNINSWAGGVSNIWPVEQICEQQSDSEEGVWNRENLKKKQSQFKPQRLGDGTLEVIGVSSILHLARTQVGLDHPIKICQGDQIQIEINGVSKQAMQIDGEPQEINTPVQLNFKLIEKVHMLSKLQYTTINWESKLIKTMNWAQDCEIISRDAKQKILEHMLH